MVDLKKKSLSDLIEMQYVILSREPTGMERVGAMLDPNYKFKDTTYGKLYVAVTAEIDRREGEYKTLATMYRILRNKFSEYERTHAQHNGENMLTKKLGPQPNIWDRALEEQAKLDEERIKKHVEYIKSDENKRKKK